MKITRFLDTYSDEHDDFTLSLRAGYIDEDGVICNAQLGAKKTFAIGMPIYSEGGEELGRLSIGLWNSLDYSSVAHDGMNIPVENWRIDGYNGEKQPVKTYFQHRADIAKQRDQLSNRSKSDE